MRIHRFFRIFLQLAGRRIGLTFFLLLLTGAVQSVGLFLIVPFLHLIGIGEAKNTESIPPLIRKIIEISEQLGVSWRLENALILFFVAICVVGVGKYLLAISSSELVRTITREFQVKQYQNWLYRPWIDSRKSTGGDILNMVQQDSSQLSQFLKQSLTLCSTAVVTLFYCLVALNLSPWFTSMAVLCGGVMFLGLTPFRRRHFKTSESIRRSFKAQYDGITEHLNALKLIKAFEREERESGILAESAGRIQDQLHQMSRLQSMVSLIQSIVGAGLLSLIVYFAISQFPLNQASLLLLIFIFARLVPMLGSLQGVWQRLISTLPSVSAIAERFSEEIKNPIPQKYQSGSVQLENKIFISDLSFSWPQSNRPLIGIRFFKGCL